MLPPIPNKCDSSKEHDHFKFAENIKMIVLMTRNIGMLFVGKHPCNNTVPALKCLLSVNLELNCHIVDYAKVFKCYFSPNKVILLP